MENKNSSMTSLSSVFEGFAWWGIIFYFRGQVRTLYLFVVVFSSLIILLNSFCMMVGDRWNVVIIWLYSSFSSCYFCCWASKSLPRVTILSPKTLVVFFIFDINFGTNYSRLPVTVDQSAWHLWSLLYIHLYHDSFFLASSMPEINSLYQLSLLLDCLPLL